MVHNRSTEERHPTQAGRSAQGLVSQTSQLLGFLTCRTVFQTDGVALEADILSSTFYEIVKLVLSMVCIHLLGKHFIFNTKWRGGPICLQRALHYLVPALPRGRGRLLLILSLKQVERGLILLRTFENV